MGSWSSVSRCLLLVEGGERFESLLVADSRVGGRPSPTAAPQALATGSMRGAFGPGPSMLRRGGSLSGQIGGGAGLTRGGDGSRLRWRHGAGCGWLR